MSMSMNSEQVLRSEINYRMEQGQGRPGSRLSSWARAEGRSETLVRRGWRRVRPTSGPAC
ncbi:hypothetical protein [Nocardioides terrisoli]|uniref:hypothetical protein n=1 Tax=Nocardioides terrisoli TaxID=3388267 RepID=UPI00287BC624|nr:hypothetical protein [Nocardioides marmorisolisilvae]